MKSELNQIENADDNPHVFHYSLKLYFQYIKVLKRWRLQVQILGQGKVTA